MVVFVAVFVTVFVAHIITETSSLFCPRAYKIYMEEDALDWENDVLCVGSKMSFEDVKLTTKREHVEAFCGEGGR